MSICYIYSAVLCRIPSAMQTLPPFLHTLYNRKPQKVPHQDRAYRKNHLHKSVSSSILRVVYFLSSFSPLICLHSQTHSFSSLWIYCTDDIVPNTAIFTIIIIIIIVISSL